jgi:RNA-directed DNA polymerase
LGFQIRRYNHRTLLTKPQKKKVIKHLRDIKAYLNTHQQEKTEKVIYTLNPVVRGWANYYRHCAAKQVFSKVRHRQWQMLWQWAKRRHPNKPSNWVKTHYFRNDGWWTFHDGKYELVKPDKTPITRFTKVTGRNSPYDPSLRKYWQARHKRQVARQTYIKKLLVLLRTQDNRCVMCHFPFTPENEIQIHHNVPRNSGGTDELSNLRAVHSWCHHQHHQRSGYKVHKA